MIGKEGGRNVARKKLETLTEQMYYIFLSLAGEPRHGYGIMQDVSQRTGGRVNIGAGTLYALLARFEEEGLIALTDTREGRKYYLFTGEGRRILRDEYDRLRRQVADGADALEKEEFS